MLQRCPYEIAIAGAICVPFLRRAALSGRPHNTHTSVNWIGSSALRLTIQTPPLDDRFLRARIDLRDKAARPTTSLLCRATKGARYEDAGISGRPPSPLRCPRARSDIRLTASGAGGA